MALESTGTNVRTPIPRKGQIRRCWVRHVAIVPGNGLHNLVARMKSVGGTASFLSRDSGFCVTLSMPIEVTA